MTFRAVEASKEPLGEGGSPLVSGRSGEGWIAIPRTV